MRARTRVDSAGRIVIPKELRERYGLDPGREVSIVPLPDGISLVPDRRERRFVRRGRLLTIDTGAGPASADQFDVDRLRAERMDWYWQ